MTPSDLAAATGLARPTVRRIVLTLRELGCLATTGRGFTLTPRVLDLGMASIGSQGLWDIARPHMECLVQQTHESSSMAQLAGSDIVYVARVAVPKNEDLAVGVRSVAAPVRDGDGRVVAAMNVTVHAAETSVETLVEQHLPHLLRTVSAVSADRAAWQGMPMVTGQRPVPT